MHIPAKFKQDNIEALLALIQQHPFATLVTLSEEGVVANHLPLSLIESAGKLYLIGHIAKANSLWQSAKAFSEVLVIFHGPHSYISPNYYPTKQENAKAVPTWNYAVVHVTGKLRFIHDQQWLVDALERLTIEHERTQPVPWSMSDTPDSYIQQMLSAIVGIEIAVESISGKWKLSQNQPKINQQGVVDSLLYSTETNSQTLAAMMRANLQPASEQTP